MIIHIISISQDTNVNIYIKILKVSHGSKFKGSTTFPFFGLNGSFYVETAFLILKKRINTTWNNKPKKMRSICVQDGKSNVWHIADAK